MLEICINKMNYTVQISSNRKHLLWKKLNKVVTITQCMMLKLLYPMKQSTVTTGTTHIEDNQKEMCAV